MDMKMWLWDQGWTTISKDWIALAILYQEQGRPQFHRTVLNLMLAGF